LHAAFVASQSSTSDILFNDKKMPTTVSSSTAANGDQEKSFKDVTEMHLGE